MDKTCSHCQKSFNIPEEDLEFFEKISPQFSTQKIAISPPTLCRDCRLQRRVTWRNEDALYKRACGKCTKTIISIFSPDKPTPAYCNTCWWGDTWDPTAYGKTYDPSRPFFAQLKELMEAVPQLAIQNDDGITSINCAYCQDFCYGKNCYFVVGSWYTENSYYCSINASYNKYICDSSNLAHSELAYECTDSQKLYNCAYLQNSENCNDCTFGFDIKGCKNCFACIGLRQKQYYIFNQPYTKEEYEKKLQEFRIDSYEKKETLSKQFQEWIQQFPRKNMNLQNCEGCVGNDLLNCHNCYGFSLLHGDHAKYCDQGDHNTYSYDIFNSGRPSWCYEGMTPDDSYMSHFCWFCWKCKNTLYSLNCHSSENLFGCISIRRGKYIILNKQYSQEEYEALAPQIIEKMKREGEWSEFMPASMSYFAYNETIAQQLFPITPEEATDEKLGWKAKDPKEYKPQTYQIPDEIKDAPENITQEILACVTCRKNFKIIAGELDLYRKMGLPIPRKCPSCRKTGRLDSRTPYKTWLRNCGHCQTPIHTSYAPERPEIVYCEKCYLETIY